MKKMLSIMVLTAALSNVAVAESGTSAANSNTVTVGYKNIELTSEDEYEVSMNVWTLGYQHWINDIFGVEINYGQSSYSTPDSLNNGSEPIGDTSDLKISSLWQLHGLAGYRFDWGRLYSKLGMSLYEFDEREESDSADNHFWTFAVGVESKPIFDHHVIGMGYEISNEDDFDDTSNVKVKTNSLGIYYGYRF